MSDLARAREISRLTVEPEEYEDGGEYIPGMGLIIPQQGFWTGNNNLGASVQFNPDPSNRQTILSMPEWGPPERWTVSLGIEFDTNQVTALDRYAMVGEITVGVGGGTQSFEVDWLQGTQFTCAMNSIDVTAFFDVGFAAINQSAITMNVMLARGAGPNSSLGATRSIHTSMVSGASSAVIRIPTFAKTLVPIPFDTIGTAGAAYDSLLFAASTEYRFLANNDIATFPALAYSTIYTGDNLAARNGRLPVPPFASFFEVARGGAAIDMLAMFELAF